MQGFNWDSGNKEKSWIKHRITRRQAEQVFFDKEAVQFEDVAHSEHEKRFVIIGKTKNKRHLHIAFTFRKELIRIISARVANKKEQRYYEENKQNTKI